MSTLITDPFSVPFIPADALPSDFINQIPDRTRLLDGAGWSGWAARRRLRGALRDLAEDKHLLADIGLTREQTLEEAAKPFWR